MKKPGMLNFFTFLTTFLFLSACSSDKAKNNLLEMRLNGNVKSIDETQFKAVEKFGEVQRGEMESKEILIFDKKGYLKEKKTYNYDGSLSSKDIYKYYESGYLSSHDYYGPDGNLMFKSIHDKKGNELEAISYLSEGTLRWKQTTKYDDKGNEMEKKSVDPYGTLNWKTISKYNEKGNKITVDEYDSVGGLTSRSTNSYDTLGNLIEENLYGADGILKSKWSRVYDEQGNEIETHYSSPSNQLFSLAIRKYNEKGDIIEMRSQSGLLGDLISTFEYLEIDKKGNWLKKVENKDTKPFLVTERNIVYFNE